MKLLHISSVKFVFLEICEANLLWGLNNTLHEMTMLSTNMFNIKWTLHGKLKILPTLVPWGDVILLVDSTFTLNQINGQVIEHEDELDLSTWNPLAQAYFLKSWLACLIVEAIKDITKIMKGVRKTFNQGKKNDRSSYYLDPFVDLRKVNDLNFAYLGWNTNFIPFQGIDRCYIGVTSKC